MGVHSRLVKSNEPALKKRLGQHFLRDTGILDRIVRWIQPSPNDLFLDIGAGDGALSTRLAQRAAHLIAVEVDLDCIPRLEKALESFENTTIIAQDILLLDLPELIACHLQPGQKLRIAGNLPYNAATAIIEKLLHASLPIEDLRFMVQLEVAQRITAAPGSRQYGFLSVACQHHSHVRMGPKVSPSCFVPRPQVHSAMVSFHPKNKPTDLLLESAFEVLSKGAFAYRRKTIGNSLRRHPQYGKISKALLAQASIDGSRRAEELSVAEYENLAHILCSEFEEPFPERR
jgi:16S rRNA (adenine1518-N6/adenine1519-N6)-dimethyltransferase